MLAAQGGVCAVCEKPDPEHFDHDHETGVVRGMLCFNCNQALGNARDDVEVLRRLRN
jgi:Recombination endonuclease VII